MLVIRHTAHRNRRKSYRTIAGQTLNKLRRVSGLSGPIWTKIINNRFSAPPQDLCRELAQAHAAHHRLHPATCGIHWAKTSGGWQPARTTRAESPPLKSAPHLQAAAHRQPSPKNLPNVTAHTAPAPVTPRQHSDDHPTCPEATGSVQIATDASGRGSWAAVIRQHEQIFRIGGSSPFREHLTEIHAVVAALEWLPGQHETIDIVTDCLSSLKVLNSAPSQHSTSPKENKRNTPKMKRLREQNQLKLRFDQVVGNHGSVSISYRRRDSAEITAAHHLATALGLAVREQRDAEKPRRVPTHPRRAQTK